MTSIATTHRTDIARAIADRDAEVRLFADNGRIVVQCERQAWLTRRYVERTDEIMPALEECVVQMLEDLGRDAGSGI